ncbi:SDR family oxidoreductase [Gordonia sp. PP30]|uniref:SDR family oxidoreductase n=1 Tax=Gordonia sp. PP30 TaxID=2935861 RepID=UPI001FFF6072|nr:SDR family oxidoreductase [Gordonia sp. PP30]UQE76157.1 SDR family oxidoreductase [Gordonia sp. PP30]
MTHYFVTGGSGFIGRRVLARLLADDDAQVTVLIRRGSLPRFATALEQIPGGERVVTAVGDLAEENLGLAHDDPLSLAAPDRRIDHVIHLGAIYDLNADDDALRAVNVDGTARVAEFAVRHDAMLHHVSTVSVGGDHDGDFTENDFDLGQDFPTAYHRTKFEAERAVRETPDLRWRVYRPTGVVGDSVTGEMDRVDGPYFFFEHISALGQLPSFVPIPIWNLGEANLVPVDYVADALVALLGYHPGESGLVFHLADPRCRTITDVLNALAPAVGAPRVFSAVPPALARPVLAATGYAPLRPGRDLVVGQLGVPPVLLDMVALPMHVRSETTAEVLDGLGVVLPDLDDYAPRLWEYWAEHLDPSRHRRDDERGPLVGKKIVITGGSSGIGKATARMCITRGADVILVARDAERLTEVADELNAEVPKPGLPLGTASAYPADITDEATVRTLVKSIIAEHDHIDILVNNAGRSIRRATVNALDRAHDYQRTMAVNYFGAVYMTLSVLPHMISRQSGHIVNVSSAEMLRRAPRFGAYAASNAALEAFADSTSAETLSDHVTFTNVRLPLTRTRMITPTSAYDARRGIWGVDKSANRVLKAIVTRPKRVNSFLGGLADFGHWAAPRLTTRILHQEYLLQEESPAALGEVRGV